MKLELRYTRLSDCISLFTWLFWYRKRYRTLPSYIRLCGVEFYRKQSNEN